MHVSLTAIRPHFGKLLSASAQDLTEANRILTNCLKRALKGPPKPVALNYQVSKSPDFWRITYECQNQPTVDWFQALFRRVAEQHGDQYSLSPGIGGIHHLSTRVDIVAEQLS